MTTFGIEAPRYTLLRFKHLASVMVTSHCDSTGLHVKIRTRFCGYESGQTSNTAGIHTVEMAQQTTNAAVNRMGTLLLTANNRQNRQSSEALMVGKTVAYISCSA